VCERSICEGKEVRGSCKSKCEVGDKKVIINAWFQYNKVIQQREIRREDITIIDDKVV